MFEVVNAQRDSLVCILVGDDHTLALLSSCFTVSELNDIGIAALLNVHYARENMISIPVIYFLSSVASVTMMISDYRDPNVPKYDSVFVFTTFDVDDLTMGEISNSLIMPHILEFRQIVSDFQSSEARVALLGNGNGTFHNLYISDSDTERNIELRSIATRLAGLCISLGEHPIIRFDSSGSKFARTIAESVERQINIMTKELPEWNPRVDERALLLVVDRKFDPVSPLMHDFTYQSMIYDLLETDGAVVKVPSSSEEKDQSIYLLSDNEDTFAEMRHKHIAAVSEEVHQQFNTFRGQNAAAKLKGSADTSVQDMTRAARALPQFQAQLRVFSKHMDLAKTILDDVDRLGLYKLALLEQDMATGIDEERERTKKKDNQARLLECIKNPGIGAEEKLRLIMIYIIAHGGISASTRSLLQLDVPSRIFTKRQVEAVANLSVFGIDVFVDKESRNAESYLTSKSRIELAKKRNASQAMQLMRFRPVVEDLFEGLCSDTLSQKTYKFTQDAPPTSSGQAQQKTAGIRVARGKKWGVGASKDTSPLKTDSAPHHQGQRIILVVCGGVTYSEMRATYELSAKLGRDLLLVSTHTSPPKKYIDDLASPVRAPARG